jgi:hypothetical protein
LVLFDQAGIKAAGPVTRGGQFKLAFIGLNGLAAVAITAVIRIREVVLDVAQVIIEFGIKRCLDRDLGQHLLKLFEVFLSFNAFSSCLCDCL